MRSNILDEAERIMNKKRKVQTDDVPTIHASTWEQAKETAKNIFLNPGWAVYYVRTEGFIDHVSIVPDYENGKPLNLYEAKLLHATSPPIGQGVGPLTNDFFDQSGTRICNAFEFIEEYKGFNSYKKLFFGPPPAAVNDLVKKAGQIAKQIVDTGLIDDKPIVFSFGMLPVIKKFFVSYYDLIKKEAKIMPIKKLHRFVTPLYCGELVGEIWKRAGIEDIPVIKFLKIQGTSSFTLFNWSKQHNTILEGLSWDPAF